MCSALQKVSSFWTQNGRTSGAAVGAAKYEGGCQSTCRGALSLNSSLKIHHSDRTSAEPKIAPQIDKGNGGVIPLIRAPISVETQNVKKILATKSRPLRTVQICSANALNRIAHAERMLTGFPERSTNGPNQYIFVNHIGFRFFIDKLVGKQLGSGA